MAINYVKGQILADNLERDGINLSFSNANIGINTLNPTSALEVVGNITVGNVVIPNVGNVTVGNVNINNLAEPLVNSDAATKFYIDQAIANVGGGQIGNLILMGTNAQGALISNAVTLTANTYVTDGIALLNQVLGKLVPPAPPAFPASQSLTISSVSSYRMANITQVNNTANSLTVAAGATVTTARRAATYATNTISTAGPGDSGTISLFRNGSNIANVTLESQCQPHSQWNLQQQSCNHQQHGLQQCQCQYHSRILVCVQRGSVGQQRTGRLERSNHNRFCRRQHQCGQLVL
jgi:hypothetical protein